MVVVPGFSVDTVNPVGTSLSFGNGTFFWRLGRHLDSWESGYYDLIIIPVWDCQFAALRSVLGCTEPEACNFDPEANEEDGSCEYLSCAYCNVESARNYEPVGSFLNNASVCSRIHGYDCNGDCLPEFLVDGECVVNTEAQASLTMAINPILGAGGQGVYI